jgi:tRNA-2-methylthio-N6-dimethylallyladenosine synthase
MPGHYYIKTFGCQMNEYDSTRIEDVLAVAEGLSPAADEQSADILLMNTCSVRDKAEDKVYSLLGTWRLLKAQRPGIIIGVGGCVASQEGEAITARAPLSIWSSVPRPSIACHSCWPSCAAPASRRST